PAMIVSHPEREFDEADGVMSAAYLQDESLPPPADPQADRLNRRGSARSADGDNQNNNAGGNGQQPKNEKLATADKLGEKPQDNSLEFLRAETVLLKPGKHQFDIGFQYAIQERSFPILFHSIDQTGPVDDIHVKTTSDKA